MVEELGFYTEVGLGAPRAEEKNKNANLEHSIGYRFQRIKGHFVTPSAHQPQTSKRPAMGTTFIEPPFVARLRAPHCLTLCFVPWHSGLQVLSLRLPEPDGAGSCERR